MRARAVLSYVEEEGFIIQREGKEIRVCGTCEGEYEYYYEPAKINCPVEESYPAEYDLTQLDIDVWVNTFIDEDDNEVDIILTEEEEHEFHIYMSDKLDEVAEDYDWEE